MSMDNRVSKKMSYILRHNPQEFGIVLDDQGWTSLGSLRAVLGVPIDQLKRIVDEDKKKRYSIEGSRIRANQGHSVDHVNIKFKMEHPPDILFHGTCKEAVISILDSGEINKQTRHHVHLSDKISTAIQVGGRRGKPVIIHIDAKSMDNDGFTFYLSSNGVWLCDIIPDRYFLEVEELK